MSQDWEALKDHWIELLISGDKTRAVAQASALLAEGVGPLEFFQKIITPALEEIGRLFEELEVFIPELTIAGETVQTISDQIINPALATAAQEHERTGTVILGTVKGDLHNIGKNMVALMLGVHGFNVIDLGTDVPPAEFVTRAEKDHADIIGLSALLTTTLPYMKDVLDRLVALGLRDKYRVIIGGAPTSPEVAHRYGADAYGANAVEAVRICRELMAAHPSA